MNIQDLIENVKAKEPLFTALVTQLKPIRDEYCPTLGTDGEELRYNQKFLDSLTEGEASGTVLHEVLHCLTKDAIISGSDRPISDYKIGLPVITKNGRLQLVNQVMKRQYRGNIYTIKPRGCLLIEATSEHPFYAHTTHWKTINHKNIREVSEGKWTKAEDLRVFTRQKFQDTGDWLLIPFIKENSQNIFLNIPIHRYKISQTVNTSIPIRMSNPILLDEDLAYFLGFYTADGFSSTNFGPSGITLGVHQVAEAIKLKRILENKFGLRGRIQEHPHHKAILFLWGSVSLARFLHQYIGDIAFTKKIPQEIMTSKKSILLSFLKGFIDGDGYITNKGIGMATISKTLALQLQLAFVRFCILLPVMECKQQDYLIEGRTGKCRNIFKLLSSHNDLYKLLGKEGLSFNKRQTEFFVVAKEGILTPITKIEQKEFMGEVYNLSVEEDQTFLANNITVHNCAFQHPWRRGKRQQFRWNMSCDYAINGIVNETFPLPKGSLIDTKYYGMSAEKIYDMLPEQPIDQMMERQGWCDKDGWGKGSGKKKGNSEANKRDRLEEKWKKLFKQNVLKQYGRIPSSMQRMVDTEYYVPVIDWTSLVAHILSEDTNDYSFSVPDRRYLDSDFILPDMASVDRLKDVVFAYDTSGSIDDQTLTSFYLETMNLFSNFSSLLGYTAICDAELHSFKEIAPQSGMVDFSFIGGGGTDFSPIFDEIKKRGMRPKAIFLFTDGEGSCPQYVPEYPVYWLIPSSIGNEYIPTMPFGEVVPFLLK